MAGSSATALDQAASLAAVVHPDLWNEAACGFRGPGVCELDLAGNDLVALVREAAGVPDAGAMVRAAVVVIPLFCVT